MLFSKCFISDPSYDHDGKTAFFWVVIEFRSIPIKTALIITSYNWPGALSLVLESVLKQTVAPDFVLVADDGSKSSVWSVVRDWTTRLQYLTQVWQPDTAFRAARVRNLAALKTDADHLVFVDGDCLLPPTFIEKHRELIRPNTLLAGARYLADARQTKVLLSGQVDIDTDLFNSVKFKSVSLGPLRYLGPRNWGAVRTCNFAVMRPDFLKVNGFDESYIGWGREDTDLVVRLINSGLTVKSGRFGACVYHLNHPVIDRSALPANDERLLQAITNPAKLWPRKSSIVGL